MRLYRLLLKLYPARFREEYEAPLQRQFRDDYQEAGGRWARIAFWARALLDLAVSIPREFARELRQDVRYSFRVYSRRPLVTFLAVAALAMAIGATTGIFSVVNALLLRSLPFRDPEHIVQFNVMPMPAGGASGYHDWIAHSTYLADAAPHTSQEMSLSRVSDAVRVKVTETSSNFFTLLGSEPEFGRGFALGEDVPGKNGVAVISYALWQQFFGHDPRVLGSTIHINGAPMTVIGVTRPTLDFPGHTAVWAPTAFDLERLPKRTGAFFFSTLVRLKPGLTTAQATVIMHADVKQLAPKYDWDKNPDEYPRLAFLREQLAGPVQKASMVLMGVVAFVLLIACSNVANLLLARVTERKPEMAVRAALGASRARLVQQLITESILLAAIAAAAGLLVAHWASRLAMSAQPSQLAIQEYTILDWRVLVFAIGIAGLTGVLFGVFPAYLSSRLQPAGEMIYRSGGAGTGAGRLRRVLIAMQVSFTLMLLAGSIVMGRGFLKLLGMDLGFPVDRVVTLSVSLVGTRYEKTSSIQQYVNEALDRLRAVPGIESAGGVDYLPLGNFASTIFMRDHLELEGGGQLFDATPIAATPDYFRAMGMELLYGREFTSADRKGSEPVLVVNEKFAQNIGPGSSVIGRKLTSKLTRTTATIVGVVRAVRYAGPPYGSFSQLFVAQAQAPRDFLTFVARVRGRPADYLPLCRDAVQTVDREVAVFNVSTLDDHLAEMLARPRFYTTAILFFGGFALLLAIIGIHGVASYSVAQRSHEIGVRIAVGATSGGVRLMILRDGLLPVAIGMIAGMTGAFWLGRFLEHLMKPAEPVGFATCSAAALSLAGTAAIAIWTATHRVVKLDPMVVLRAE